MASWAQRNAPVRFTVDDLGPLFVAQIFHGNCGSIHAGVVKENIQPAELVAGRGKQGSDRAGLPNVGRDGKHGAPA